MGIDWSSAWAAGQHSSTVAAVAATATSEAAPVAATTTAAAVVAATTTKAATTAAAKTTSSTSPLESAVTSLWGDLVGLSNNLKSFGTAITSATGSEVSYIGNYGSPQGSNMIKVSSRTGYDYTNEFINTSGESMTVVLWNKAYDAGNGVEANLGASMAPKTPILSFALAPGESQIVAFQENSQIGWCQAVSDIAESGAFATTWGEMNFVSTGSGYDVSAIMNPNNNNYDMTITSAEAPHCTSSRTENFWLTETDPVGDSNGSCYIAQSTATITTKMGGPI